MLDLSNWDDLSKNIPSRITFGQWMQDKHPDEWQALLQESQKVLDEHFAFLKKWKVNIHEVRELASRLLSGGIIMNNPGIDFRVAGVLADNVLVDEQPVDFTEAPQWPVRVPLENRPILCGKHWGPNNKYTCSREAFHYGNCCTRDGHIQGCYT